MIQCCGTVTPGRRGERKDLLLLKVAVRDQKTGSKRGRELKEIDGGD